MSIASSGAEFFLPILSKEVIFLFQNFSSFSPIFG
jgi:hypothetical protein